MHAKATLRSLVRRGTPEARVGTNDRTEVLRQFCPVDSVKEHWGIPCVMDTPHAFQAQKKHTVGVPETVPFFSILQHA